jgi:hypothetical protein
MPDPNCYEVGQTLYRIEDHKVGCGSYEEDYSADYRVHIDTRKYKVLRLTPRGAWIQTACSPSRGLQRFVLCKGKKKYAYPTLELAWESFLIRKQRRIQYLREQIEYAQSALAHSSSCSFWISRTAQGDNPFAIRPDA